MLPRLPPRRDSSRCRSTSAFWPAPSNKERHERHHPNSIAAEGYSDDDNNNNDHDNITDEYSENNSLVGIDTLETTTTNLSSFLMSSSSTKSNVHFGRSRPSIASRATAAPWSPPRSNTSKNSSNNREIPKEPSPSQSEECTTPTNNCSHEYFDDHSQQHYVALGNHKFDDLALTPPATTPAPLLVSAKRLGTEVRSLHSKRRRSYLANTASDSSPLQTDDGEQLMIFADRIRLRNGRRGPIRRFDCWKETDDDHEGNNEGEEHYDNACFPLPLDPDDDDEPYPLLPAIIHSLPPQEQQRRYWQLCYGSEPPNMAPTPPVAEIAIPATEGTGGWSASRAPPVRSCLSSAKKVSHFSGSAMEAVATNNGCWTPNGSPEEVLLPRATMAAAASQGQNTKSVQFGSPKAAEYEVDAPSVAMTPLPSEVARARFPIDDPWDNPQKQEELEEELELIKETKINTQILKSWEMAFDDFDEVDYSSFTTKNHDDEKENSRENNASSFVNDDNDKVLAAYERRKRRSSGIFSRNQVPETLLAWSEGEEEESTDDESDHKKKIAADLDEDNSIAAHISNLYVVTSPRDHALTPLSTAPGSAAANNDVSRNETVVVPEGTNLMNSNNSGRETTTPSSDTITITMGMTPPSDVSYASVHSSGAAFVKSAFSPPNVESNREMLGRTLEYEMPGDDTNWNEHGETMPADDLLVSIRNKPSTNGDYLDASIVLRTMARHGMDGRSRSRTKIGDDKLMSFLALVGTSPCGMDIITNCVPLFHSSENLRKKAPANLTENIERRRGKLEALSSGYHDCMNWEIAIWKRLSEGIAEIEEGFASFRAVLDNAELPQIDLDKPKKMRLGILKRQRQRLEQSIRTMREEFSNELQFQDLIKTKLDHLRVRCNLERTLPFPILTFRLTAALLSFKMIGCECSTVVWRMDHVVDGIESEITWDMATGTLVGCLVATESSGAGGDKIPMDHVAGSLHQALAVRCMESCRHSRHHFGNSPDEVHEEEFLVNRLAQLAMILGRVDLLVKSLWLFLKEQTYKVTLEEPEVGGSILRIVLDPLDDKCLGTSLRITFDSSALPSPSTVERKIRFNTSSDIATSDWTVVDNWQSSLPWALGSLFQDINSAASR